jgi:hypothetical protein
MLGLGFPERPGGGHLGHDLRGPAARGVDVGDRLLGDAALLLIETEDCRAIARPDVVALTVQRGRVVDLEEELEQLAVRGLLGIEDDLDRLRVPVMFAVGRVRNIAPGVADPGEMTPGRFRKRSSIPQKHPPARIAFSTPSLTYRPPRSPDSSPACPQARSPRPHRRVKGRTPCPATAHGGVPRSRERPLDLRLRTSKERPPALCTSR